MANPYPPDPLRNPADLRRRLLAATPSAESSPEPMPDTHPITPPEAPSRSFIPPPPPSGESTNFGSGTEDLRAENAELRRLIETAIGQEQEFDAAKAQWSVREKELEQEMLMLHQQIQEMEQHITDQPEAKPLPSESEMAKMFDELEMERNKFTQEKRHFDDERSQLREDEEALAKQMREMEVQMARERADMARQRQELQRLQAEIKAELESMQRGDAAMKDKLSQFQRRSQEAANRPGQPPPSPQQPGAATPPAKPPTNRDSGIMKRFFGGNK